MISMSAVKYKMNALDSVDKNQLFSQFASLTPKPTGSEHYTGLGLFIVKKLVDSKHGKVWCESVLGQGTTFIVQLPVFSAKYN